MIKKTLNVETKDRKLHPKAKLSIEKRESESRLNYFTRPQPQPRVDEVERNPFCLMNKACYELLRFEEKNNLGQHLEPTFFTLNLSQR